MANIRNNHDDDDGLPPPDLASPRHPPPSFHNLRVDTPAYQQYYPYTPGVSVPAEGLLVNRRMKRTAAVSSLSSSAFTCRTPPGLFDDHRRHPAGDEERHFLDSCAMCNRPLGNNQDIFMYRGNIPFCSEECRQDRIDTDEFKDRKWSNLTAKAIMSTRNSSTSSNQPMPIKRPTGAVVAG